MIESTDPFDRQRRLPEVGDAGQTRIESAELRLFGSDGAMVELSYLLRAGVRAVEMAPGSEPVPFAHEAAFVFSASRRVGAGAWRALDKLRALLAPNRS